MTFAETANMAGSIAAERRSASAGVVEGKRILRRAIASKNVENFKEALGFLATTKLAYPVPREHQESMCDGSFDDGRGGGSSAQEGKEGNGGEDPRALRLEINVDFRYRWDDPRGDDDCIGSDSAAREGHVLSALIGPDPVHTEMVRCLLEPQKQPLNVQHERGTLSSVTAPRGGARAVVVVLLTTNAKQRLLERSHDVRRNAGMTPLARACQAGNRELALLLLEHGADPNACGNEGLTPLIRMARRGNLEMVRLLLEPGIGGGETGSTAIASTAMAPAVTAGATLPRCPYAAAPHRGRLLPNPSAQRDHDSNDNNTNGSSDGYGNFHKNRWGTDVFRYDQQAMNALIHACTDNHEPVVRFLCSGGPRGLVSRFVNDYKVDPALWYASAHGNASIVRFLMDSCGARAEYRKDPTVYSSTPLEEASEWGHSSAVEVLLEREGSDPRSPTGRKARLLAGRAGYAAVVKVLDKWKNRLNGLESCLDGGVDGCRRRPTTGGESGTDEGLSPGLLPFVLSKTARRYDLAYQILSGHVHSLCCGATRGFDSNKRDKKGDN